MKLNSLFLFLKGIFIYNRFIIINLLGVYRDMSNIFYSAKCFVDFSRTPVFIQNKGRLDWIKFPYFVVNLDKEFFDQTEPVQNNLMINRFSEVFNTLNEYVIFDITNVKIERIKMNGIYTNSLLVYFRPVFYYISIRKIIMSIIFYYFLYTNYYEGIVSWLKTIMP